MVPGSGEAYSSGSYSRIQMLAYFVLTVLGFSFWFFMVVPFASHRETYWWLGMVHSQPFAKALGVISSTYRPIAQGATWSAFRILDPSIFPTSYFRQLLLQGFIYAMFVVAWWLIYTAAPQKRVFALIAFVGGGVFFSGYVHLFHIYGLFYVPVLLMLGALLRFSNSGGFKKREIWFAVTATLLAFWHPFATALFLSFYFGFCLETFRQRTMREHARALVILAACMLAIAGLVVFFPRAQMPLDTRLLGFLVSYQTNEVNRIASFVAFVLAQVVIFSMGLSPKLRIGAILLVSVLSVILFLKSVPLLLLWLCIVLLKLFRLHRWSLFFLALAASLLPFGGGIGSPMYALFAIIVGLYATALSWPEAEKSLVFLKPEYVATLVVFLSIIILTVRAGKTVPVVTKVATPLLSERERTYQLENILAWMHTSSYCGREISFAENADNPVDSVESAITRRYRPPSGLPDVLIFWDASLRCGETEHPKNQNAVAVVTFGTQSLANFNPVYEIKGKYAGDATVWIANSQN